MNLIRTVRLGALPIALFASYVALVLLLIVLSSIPTTRVRLACGSLWDVYRSVVLGTGAARVLGIG